MRSKVIFIPAILIILISSLVIAQSKEITTLNIKGCPIKLSNASSYNVKLENTTENPIFAVRFKVVYFNPFNEFVGVEYYTNVRSHYDGFIDAGSTFEFKWEPKFLEDYDAFHFFIYVDKCTHTDGTIWTQPDDKLLAAISKLRGVPVTEMNKYKPQYERVVR